MKLELLLKTADIPNNLTKDLLLTKVSGISTNSKEIKAKDIFIAKKGYTHNGHLFINEAFKKGALIAVVQKHEAFDVEEKYKSRLVEVADSSKIIGKLCKVFYTSLPENIWAITGTNGKTSTAFFCSQILTKLKIPNVVIGTIGIFFNGKKQYNSPLTTPEPTALFKILSLAKKKGINYAVLEASSEGIAEKRLEFLPINRAAFTNLTQDHLNYHKTLENYYLAKSRLFLKLLAKNNCAVINVDDKFGLRLKKECCEGGIPVVEYGKNALDMQLKTVALNPNGYDFTIFYKDQEYKISLNILGEFQVYNVLCSMLLLALEPNIDFLKIVKLVPTLQAATGRLELIKEYNQAKIFVDYAHTPSALFETLISLKKITPGKLIVVFGCGGNREKEKRKIMGEIAAKYADFAYITDDNPRHENNDHIREEILEGYLKVTTKNYLNIGDRKEAIVAAVTSLTPGDTLLIAGKGHENYQIINNQKIYFSDIEVVKSIL